MIDTPERKCKARSIRMTERVEKYVLAHPGEGFNQKFESLVLNYKEAEPALNKRIKEKQRQLYDLLEKIETAQDALDMLNTIVLDCERLKATTDRALDRVSD